MFERLGITRERWEWYIRFNVKFKLKERRDQQVVRELAAKNFWINKLHLDPFKCYPKWATYGGDEAGIMSNHKNYWGTLIIEYPNTLMRKLLINLLKIFSIYVEKRPPLK